MISRRTFLAAVVAGSSPPLVPPAVSAQTTGKVARIRYVGVGNVGVPSPRDEAGRRAYLEALRQGLRDLGYLEGQTILIEDTWVDIQRLPVVAEELVRSKPDVLVAQGNAVVAALQHATTTIPIVAAAFGDPVGSGFVASFARPGGNITGFSTSSEEMNTKWLEFLKETVPRLSRVGILWNTTERNWAALQPGMEGAAQKLALTLQLVEVGRSDDITRAFTAFTRGHVGAFITWPGIVTGAHRRLILDLASTNRLPGMHPWTVFVEDGGLMCYGPDLREMLHRSAYLVDKILKGARPAVLPVEQPNKFHLVINLKTAKALGLTIPPSLLLRADQVIE
jgi:putative ABC transport system substrate-binding protein